MFFSAFALFYGAACALFAGEIESAALWVYMAGGCSMLAFPRIWLALMRRLGLARLCYSYSNFLQLGALAGDIRGYACLEMLKALPYSKHQGRKNIQIMMERQPSQGPLGVLAGAIFARENGGNVLSLQIYHALDAWEPYNTGGLGRAQNWARRVLMAEAAAQGHWATVLQMGQKRSLSWENQLFVGVVARILQHPHSLSTWRLYLSWLLSPRHRLWWGWLRRPPLPPPLPPQPGGPLETALNLHQWALQQPVLSIETLLEWSRAWDTVRENPSLDVYIGRRIAMLEARVSPESIREQFLISVRKEMLEALPRCIDPLQERFTGILETLRYEAWEQRAQTVERYHQALIRLQQQDDQEAIHWGQWGLLVKAWNSAVQVGERDQRRMLFLHLWSGLNNYGAYLANKRNYKLLANQIFRYLLKEGQAIGGVPPEDMGLLMRNVNVKYK